ALQLAEQRRERNARPDFDETLETAGADSRDLDRGQRAVGDQAHRALRVSGGESRGRFEHGYQRTAVEDFTGVHDHHGPMRRRGGGGGRACFETVGYDEVAPAVRAWKELLE